MKKKKVTNQISNQSRRNFLALSGTSFAFAFIDAAINSANAVLPFGYWSTQTFMGLWAFGSNTTGALGDGSSTNSSRPKRIGVANDFATISATKDFSHVINTNGTLWSWGFNNNTLADGNTSGNKSSPIQIGTLST
ncbi:MAG: hypothetical protein K2Q18_02690, partial [Bdellovibrionales bacterium]|nr:hypothetical protein [Bdellovibrionales bacterium]